MLASRLVIFPARGDYIDGRFVRPARPDGEIRRQSPADFRELVGVFPHALEHVDAAVAAARAAHTAWARLGVEARADALGRLKAAAALRGDELARLIAIEVGKPAWESAGEVAALGSKIDVTLEEGAREIAPRRPAGVAGGVDWRPLGVVAILGPFNFPAHLPHGQAVPALLAGNTVVFKPSALAPAVGQLYAEIVDAAGFPPGVFNLVQGGADTGARLAAHEGVDGVLFTGSWAAGRAILESTLDQPHKLVALEMGGKNAAVVLRDAELREAAHAIVTGAFATAGQRCTATSRLIVERPVVDALLAEVLRLARGLRVGHPLEHDVFMGPLVCEEARERFLRMIARARDEGAQPVLSGGAFDAGRPGAYVSPSIHLVERPSGASAYQREEHFGPDLAVYVVDGLDEAITLANDSAYGLVASLFSRDDAAWQEFRLRARAGVLHRNRGTVGASGRLPFGGVGRSGNFRPGGVLMIASCAYPVAFLEGQSAPQRRPPGMPEV